MSALRPQKKVFTMEERLYNYALTMKCEITRAVMELRRNGAEPNEREIANAEAMLWRLRQIDKNSRMNDNQWGD